MNEYVKAGHKQVKGWLRSEAALLISQLAASQTVRGNVGEIGVHHGKLFILLCLLRQSDEHAVAIDLFEHQEANVDGSGRGDREVFERNLRSFAGGTAEITIRSTDSTTISTGDLLSWAGGPFRLFSVDGGHTAEITESDLVIASGALADGGLLILDDYYNPAWPGVSEGANRFLSKRPRAVAIGTGFGKTFFTTEAFAERYRTTMREIGREQSWLVTEQKFFDEAYVVLQRLTARDQLLHTAKTRVERLPGGKTVLTELRKRLR